MKTPDSPRSARTAGAAHSPARRALLVAAVALAVLGGCAGSVKTGDTRWRYSVARGRYVPTHPTAVHGRGSAAERDAHDSRRKAGKVTAARVLGTALLVAGGAACAAAAGSACLPVVLAAMSP